MFHGMGSEYAFMSESTGARARDNMDTCHHMLRLSTRAHAESISSSNISHHPMSDAGCGTTLVSHEWRLRTS